MADDTTSTTASETSTAPAMGETTTPASMTSQQQPSGSDVPPEVQRALHKANKEAETLRLKLKEFEDRDKTEAERLADRAATAEKAAADAAASLLKYQVAAEKNLPAQLAARLQGATKDELAADADALIKLLGSQVAAPSFDGGVRTAGPAPTDMNALIRQKAGLG